MIGLLTSLEHLQAERNLLTSAPSQLGQLRALEFLGLYNNSIDGTIPTEWSNLSGLSFFAISDNNLVGSVPAALASATTCSIQGEFGGHFASNW